MLCEAKYAQVDRGGRGRPSFEFGLRQRQRPPYFGPSLFFFYKVSVFCTVIKTYKIYVVYMFICYMRWGTNDGDGNK